MVVPDEPSARDILVGLAEMLKSGVMTSVTVKGCHTYPLVPFTVIE